MSFFWFLIPIFGFVLIKHGMDTKAKQDSEKLRVLESALRHGSLDEKQKNDLMSTLTGREPEAPPAPPRPRRQKSPHEVGFFLKFMAFCGWVAFCVGIGFVIIVANMSNTGLEIPAIILTCTGFPLLTFPFVVRELQGTPRRRATEQST